MAQTVSQEQTAMWDPSSIGVSSEFSPLNPIDLYRDIMDANSASQTNNEQKVTLLTTGISGLNLLHESSLWSTQQAIKSEACLMRTLPNCPATNSEPVSTIQPKAWIAGDAGGMYDPILGKLCINCVGHWQGEAKSQTQFIKRSLTTPCFIVFHSIAVVAIILAFTTPFMASTLVSDHPNLRVIMVCSILAGAVGVDIISILFIIIAETYFPDTGNPIEATKVQSTVQAIVSDSLNQLYKQIDANTVQLLSSGAIVTPVQACGLFIMRYFYEPAVNALTTILKLRTSPFTDSAVNSITWGKMEEMLILYKFVREIADSGFPEYTQLVEPYKTTNMKKIIVSAIQRGSADVHYQLLRMLYLSLLSPRDRASKASENNQNISLSQVVGDSLIKLIVSDLKRGTKTTNTKTASSIPDQAERALRIEIVLKRDVNFGVESWRSHSSSVSPSTSKSEIP